jgi:hypothetical protein
MAYKTNWASGNTGHVTEHNLIGAKLNRMLDVMDFGAKGDGATDDTAAIQAALNTAPSLPVYLPTGTYNVTALTIPSGVTLCGAGRGKAILQSAGNGPILAGATASVSFVVIHDLQVKRTGSQGGTGISLAGWTNGMIECVNLNNFAVGMDLDASVNGCYYNAVRNCFLYQCALGMRFYGSPTWNSNANTLADNTIQYVTTGIQANNQCRGNLLLRNDVEIFNAGTSIGIDWAGSYNTIEANWVEGNASTGSTFTGIRVTGIGDVLMNNFYSMAGSGGSFTTLDTTGATNPVILEPSISRISLPTY